MCFTLRNQNGFTLIEIIAVLIIVAVLAAIAVPKYTHLEAGAKQQAAKIQIAELKSSLNSAWGRTMIQSDGALSDADSVVTTAGFTSGTATNVGTPPDIWNITLTATTSQVVILINDRGGDADFHTADTWNIPR